MPTLSDIANLLKCPIPSAGPDIEITGLATLAEAVEGQLTFVGAEKYAAQLATTRATAAIVQKRVTVPREWEARALRVDDADLAMASVLALFAPPIPRPPVGIDPLARIAPTAVLGENAAVGPFVVIGENTRIGRDAVLHAGVFIGDDVIVGDNCEFFQHVVVRERVTIGSRVIVHAGAVIGTDGFGYRWDGRQHQKVPQIGTILIEDDVEIGSCVCVDRAKFSTTRIGRGSKLDNLVQVGHNTQIGPHCIITGQVGLAGSVTLGAGVVLGGQSAVRDHVTMGDGSMAAGCSGVAEDVEPKTIVSGLPAQPHRQTLREQGAIRQLPELRLQVKKLVEEIEHLKKRLDAGEHSTREKQD